MTSGKTLLILSGGTPAADVARHAKKLGLTVVMLDGDPQAPGFAFADSCLIADVHQPAESTAAAERYNRKIRKIDGVIAVGVQAPVTAATLAARLRLPGMPLHVAELIGDRLAARKCFVSAGVASPWFAEIRTPQDLQRAIIAQGRDLLLIPPDGQGEAGALHLGDVEDLAASFSHARSHSPTERVMVEKYPPGPRLFSETLISGGQCFTPLIADQGQDGASRQPSILLDQARALAARSASALGLSDGTLAAEMMLDDGQLKLTDFSASLSGDFCTREIPRHTGVDFLGAAIRQALGIAVAGTDLMPGKR
jgi:formate-dependent phosphoribosylglycinamide formyltransferase (GAR transformylase)